MRIAMGIQYDGAAYNGWQRQTEQLPTIQAALEVALSQVANHRIEIFCAGRTDAGVHATGQVIHFDTDAQRNERSWTLGANSNLPHDISVLWAQPVDASFHARFAAISRRYQYFIFNNSVRPSLLRQYVAWFHRPLQVETMHEAAQYLLGEHDFSSFRGIDCQAKSPNRCIKAITVTRSKELIILDVTANGFLHHMVRNIMGALLAVGVNDQPPHWIKKVLEQRDRRAASVTAPPQGLYLVNVEYPEHFQIRPGKTPLIG